MPLNDEEKALVKGEDFPRLLALSEAHDISNLIGFALNKNGLLVRGEKFSEKLRRAVIVSVYLYEQRNREYNKLCNFFETQNIQFMPLKGLILRDYYPEPWMRTSCDMDIFVQKADVELCEKFLINDFGYTFDAKGSHDISFLSQGQKNRLELHYNLIEKNLVNTSHSVLKSVWDTAKINESCKCKRELNDEMFYFYHIAHMAKHFLNGGCGIRPFIDLWILDNIEGANQKKRDELLIKGDLLEFAKLARLLSRVWFEGEAHTELTLQAEQYILRGGVYGVGENRVTVQQQRHGGRIRYLLWRIFVPYDIIKFHYPILKKHRWLTPIMEVRRWFKLVFCGHVGRSIKEISYNNKVTKATAKTTKKFLQDLGLM